MKSQLKEHFGEYFLNGKFKEVYHKTSQAFQNLVSFEQFSDLGTNYNEDVEHYTCIVSNTFQGLLQYVWVDQTNSKAIVVAFDEGDVIQVLYLKPYITYLESDQQWTENTYIMPINEEWTVFWGGVNEFVNYHYPYEQQRYAYDLVKVDHNQAYQNSTLQNENYYAFAAEVVAPADGIIVQVVDGIKDNVPGGMDEAKPAGNYCIINHEHYEFSMIAHFKKDSICVKVGEQVSAGQLLGLCGNSGNSSEAHIHFQVMDHADLMQAKSLRIKFYNDIEPIQGDIVKPIVPEKPITDTFNKI